MRKDNENGDLRKRTKEFALRIIRLYAALPKTTEAQVIGKQVLRSGTSVGAHYREGTEADPMPSTSPRSGAVFKNWRKPPTGSSCWEMPLSSTAIAWQSSATKLKS